MTTDEVIALMAKPKSNSRVPQYRIVYRMATGQDWKKCFCGNGFDIFFRVCQNYANALKNAKNNTIITTE